MAEYIAKQDPKNSNGRSLEPWEAQLRKGSLEMAILASLWTDKKYGLEILRDLDGKSSLALAEGTLDERKEAIAKEMPSPKQLRPTMAGLAAY